MNIEKRKAELWEKKIPELVEIGKGIGLRISLKAPKRGAINRIVKAEAKKETGSALNRPVLPEFESLVGGGVSPDDQVGEPVDAGQHGGYRPGAGRPLGMTNEKARMATLPQMPNPAIQGALCLAFGGWAKLADCEELALTEDEAIRLALPYTQLAAYFGIDDHIPPWAMLGITAIWTTWGIVTIRLAILKAKEAAKSVELPAPAGARAEGVSDSGHVTEYQPSHA